MFKKIGALIVTLLGLALLVYSATRSLNFITLTLSADKAVLAYFGLAALDGGLIAWLLAYKYGSRGGWQRGIALLMVIVDLLGAVLMFTADSIYETGKAGLTTAMSAGDIQTVVLALSTIIAINIAAVVAHDLTEPDRLRAQAEEEAVGRIEEQALEQVRQTSGQLAAELAPAIAEDWRRITREKYLNMMQIRPLSTGAVDAIARPALPAPAQAVNTGVAKPKSEPAPSLPSIPDSGSVPGIPPGQIPASIPNTLPAPASVPTPVPDTFPGSGSIENSELERFSNLLRLLGFVKSTAPSISAQVVVGDNDNGNHKNPTPPLPGVK